MRRWRYEKAWQSIALHGRTAVAQTVIEYLTGHSSAREIADSLAMSEPAMRLWIRKWRTTAEQSIDAGETSMVAVGESMPLDDTEPDDEESPF